MTDMEDLDEKRLALLQDLIGDDDLGVVVRGQIRVENELIRYIEAHAADLKALKRLNLDYNGLIDLALVLGLDPSLRTALSSLGALRNRFAHQLGASISKSDADNFRKCFDPKVKETLDSLQRKTVADIMKDKPDSNLSFGVQIPKIRWIMHVIALWAALVAKNAKSGA